MYLILWKLNVHPIVKGNYDSDVKAIQPDKICQRKGRKIHFSTEKIQPGAR